MERATSMIMPGDFTDEQNVLDADTFTRLYETYFSRVYNYISYRVPNRHDAEDIVSTVFERVIHKYYTYCPDHSPLEAWIIGIAKNAVTDYFRASKKRSFLLLDFAKHKESPEPLPENAAILSDEIARMVKALDVLNAKERDIISMKFATELKNLEIAKILGISETNVSSIVHRAMKKLRRELERTAQ